MFWFQQDVSTTHTTCCGIQILRKISQILAFDDILIHLFKRPNLATKDSSIEEKG